jgi:indolepyruvate ferredoxin oxidoreductase beta subunit
VKYQIVIAGFGGQGVVFLVKVLAICAGNKNIPFLGTENHGMSQRGGAVSCDIKIGDFTNPVIDKNQANLIIGLDRNESLRNIDFLKRDGGVMITNSNPKDYPTIPFQTTVVDANTKALHKEFPIQGLNVFMLGVTLANVKNFPFSVDEVKSAITQMNAKMAEQNLKILDLGLSIKG